MMDTLFKAYVYKNMFADVSKLVRKSLDKMDFDREYWLRRVGLTTHTPVKDAFGVVSLFLIGAATGAAIGLALAPKSGAKLRAEVKEKALDVLDSVTNVKPSSEKQARF